MAPSSASFPALPPVLVWLRQDLRLRDNPALAAAAESGAPLWPVFILETDRPLGCGTRWWLAGSLAALGQELAALGLPLILRQGSALEVLRDLVTETGAQAVSWNRRYDPQDRQIDEAVGQALQQAGLLVQRFQGNLLREPWTVRTQGGTAFKVFTPFWKALRRDLAEAPPLVSDAPLALSPGSIPPETARPASLSLEALDLRRDAPTGLADTWQPGEPAAWQRLQDFLDQDLAAYAAARDYPAREGTSRLSPALHWGEIAPARVWTAVQDRLQASDSTSTSTSTSDNTSDSETAPDEATRLREGADKFLSELAWREFSAHLLYHAPSLATEPLRPAFAAFPWQDDPTTLAAWQQGRTGYPLVDAGMRELAETGWMHNRVRMVCASFLVKHLLQPWQAGRAWFEERLVDWDAANNAASWQWVAGCGSDAAPYFRIFNPVTQSEKFDPEGRYLRRWLPALARLPDRWIHKPWQAPTAVLAQAGLRLGTDYPLPIIAHDAARHRALAAFNSLKSPI